MAGTLENIESLTGSIADQREDLSALIVNARKASEQLNTTIDSTNRSISDADREFVQTQPGLIDRLDKIGRAPSRERECQYVSITVVGGSFKKKKRTKNMSRQ